MASINYRYIKRKIDMQRNSLIYWGLVFIGIGLFLQCQYSYFFFYQEQLQLF